MALKFVNLPDGVDCGSNSSLDNIFTGGGTAMLWLKVTETGVLDQGGYVLVKFFSLGTLGWGINISNTSLTKRVEFYHTTASNTGIWITPTNTFTRERWFHVALTYNKNSAANNPTIYINGKSITVSRIIGPSGTLSDESTGNLYLGTDPDNAAACPSTIDDARLYRRVVSAAEMETIYAAKGTDDINKSLVARWLLNERSPGSIATGSSTVKDLSTSGNHGTPANAPAYADTILFGGRKRLF